MTLEYEEIMEEMYKKQTGGEHYKKLAITPFEYAMKNKLDACQFSVVKYITRFRDKNGLEDLQKCKDCVDILMQSEYNVEEPQSTNSNKMETYPTSLKPMFGKDILIKTEGGWYIGFFEERCKKWVGFTFKVDQKDSHVFNTELIDIPEESITGWIYARKD